MATPNIVPRAAGEGGLGTAAKGWGGTFVTNTTTSSATQGGQLVLAANDGAVMADNHRLGVIEFKGAEDASNTLSTGARIEAVCRDAWDGSNNDADLGFYTTDGTTESLVLTLDADKNATFAGDVQVSGGDITGPTDGDLRITSDGSMAFKIDADNDETSQSFEWINNTNTQIAALDETGGLQVDNNITASGGSIIGQNYRTIYVDAGGMVPAVTNGAVAQTDETHATNFTTLDYLTFDTSTEQYADFKIVMPEQYDNGTIKVKFYWKPKDAEASVSVVWGVKAYAATDSDLLTGASGLWGTEQVIEDESLNTANDLHISPATPALTIAGTPAEGKLVFVRVFRKVAAAADDYADTAELLGVNIQYKESALFASAAW